MRNQTKDVVVEFKGKQTAISMYVLIILMISSVICLCRDLSSGQFNVTKLRIVHFFIVLERQNIRSMHLRKAIP